MNITIKTHQPRGIIRELAEALGTDSEEFCLEQILALPKKYGEGTIRGFDFENGTGILIADFQLSETLHITIDNEIPPLLFNFCVQGELWHHFNHDQIQYQFSPLQGTITANVLGSVQRLKFPENWSYLFAMVFVQREAYLKKFEPMLDDMPERLAVIFKDLEAKQSFFYKNNYNIASADMLKKIVQDNSSCVVRSIFAEGKTLEILSHQLQQFQDDVNKPGKRVKLKALDVEKIQEARDILIADLTDPPTIEQLAYRIGINRQKLKSGFKLVFDATINEYLRNERLEKAVIFILEGKNVTEAMSKVGYTNRGYFSQKFQDKYGVLPKNYLQTVKTKISD